MNIPNKQFIYKIILKNQIYKLQIGMNQIYCLTENLKIIIFT